MDTSTLYLLAGLLLVIVGVALLVEFIAEFAKLVLGLLIFVVGVYLVGFGRNSSKVKVR